MRIHLLDSRAVAEELAFNSIRPNLQLRYLMIGWIFYVLTGYSTVIFTNASRSWIGFLEGSIAVVVSVFGFFYSDRSNGGDGGDHFIVRFTCLLLPALLKAHIVVWGLYYLGGWAFQALIPKITFSSEVQAKRMIELIQHMPVIMTLVAAISTQVYVFLDVAHYLRKTCILSTEQSV
jgi:hypothetical protein